MGLLSKLGGAIKEGLRKGAVNGLLKATGNGPAASGHVSSSAYEYDANGHIKGINSQYAAAVSDLYENGLMYTGDKNQNTDKSILEKYPTKYNGSYTNTSYKE